MFRTLCILVALGCAVDVAAQSPPDLPKWDLAASTGVFVGHPADPPDSGSFDEWYHTATVAVTGGRYL